MIDPDLTAALAEYEASGAILPAIRDITPSPAEFRQAWVDLLKRVQATVVEQAASLLLNPLTYDERGMKRTMVLCQQVAELENAVFALAKYDLSVPHTTWKGGSAADQHRCDLDALLRLTREYQALTVDSSAAEKDKAEFGAIVARKAMIGFLPEARQVKFFGQEGTQSIRKAFFGA